MRVVPLLVTTILLAAPGFAQQTTSTNTIPAQSTPATMDQPPMHPITVQQVHELLVLTGANRLKDQMIHNTMSYFQKAFPPYMPKDVVDDLETSFAKMDVEQIAVKVYQKHISTEDASQVIAFYKTPVGRRLVRALPLMAQEVQVSATQQAQQVVRGVMARHRDEITAAAAKYRQQQPDTPTITEPN